MTNKEAKQEAIKNIVSKYYDQYPEVKPFVQSNGFFPITNGYVYNLDEKARDFFHLKEKVFFSNEDHEEYYSHFIPLDLNDLIQEVDNNNGWIRIEPDGSNLPNKHNILYKTGRFNQDGIFDVDDTKWGVIFVEKRFHYKLITHYKPIEPEIKPIY